MNFGRMVNKKIETENNIYEAGMKLFQEKGFTNTTMQDISERAGVAKSTIFNYFSSKEEIILRFGRNQVAQLKKFAQSLPPDMDTKAKILEVLQEDVGGVEKSKEIARISLVESYKSDWVYTLEAQNRVELASVYAQILCDGQKKGDIRDGLNCEHIAGLIVAIYFHALYTGMEVDTDINIKDYIIYSLEVLWNGVSCCDFSI